MTVTILFASLALLLILNVPVGIALGFSAMMAIIASSTSLTLISLIQSLVTSCDSFPILAIWRQLHVKIITNAYSVNIKINK